MDSSHPLTDGAHPRSRPQVILECVGASVALDPIGYLDREVAETLLHIACTLDEVVGWDGNLIRLRQTTGVSIDAWKELQQAGWAPVEGSCDDDIVLRRRCRQPSR